MKTLTPRWAKAVSSPGPKAPTVPAPRPTAAPIKTPAEQVASATPYHFAFVDFSTGQATRDIGGTQAAVGVQMPYSGTVVAFAWRSSETKTAGTAGFTIVLNDADTDATASWSANNDGEYATFPPGDVVFSAGDVLYPTAEVLGFTPATADVEAIIYVSF